MRTERGREGGREGGGRVRYCDIITNRQIYIIIMMSIVSLLNIHDIILLTSQEK